MTTTEPQATRCSDAERDKASTVVRETVLIGLATMLMHGLVEDGGPEHHGYGD